MSETKNPLSQYIELYQGQRPLIEKNSAEPLDSLRHQAMKRLEDCALPTKGSENYEIIDIPELLAPDYGLNLADIAMDANPKTSFRCGVPELSSALGFVINDSVKIPDMATDGLPEGVEFTSLRELARRKPDFIKKYYGRAAMLTNPLVALNTMLMRDGVCLHVKKGVKLERPLQLVNILNSLIPLMAVRRLLIVIEEESAATLLSCDHTQSDGIPVLSLQTIEIFVGKNGKLDFYDMEESNESTRRLSSLYLRQDEGSNVTIDGITLSNGISRNEYDCRFTGSHAELHLYGLGIEDRARILDTYSFVDHSVEDCHTDELFKYVVDDNARGAFAGRIYVAPDSTGTVAYQSNRNLVGSDTARMWSKPQLEIYNDDVKCSHGTAIGQLDPMQLFYLRTRGLDEAQARMLLKQAFMADVIDGVKLQALRERLIHLIEHRFAGESTSCSGCTICH